VNFNNR